MLAIRSLVTLSLGALLGLSRPFKLTRGPRYEDEERLLGETKEHSIHSVSWERSAESTNSWDSSIRPGIDFMHTMWEVLGLMTNLWRTLGGCTHTERTVSSSTESVLPCTTVPGIHTGTKSRARPQGKGQVTGTEMKRKPSWLLVTPHHRHGLAAT